MDSIVHVFVAALYVLFYPLLYLYPNLYYPLINLGFEFINFFRRRRVVPQVKDPLLLISATEAAEKIRKNELKSVDLIKAYIKRIKEVNPIINALVTDCFEEAVEEAEKVDAYLKTITANSEEVQRLAEEKPLFGIPFTVKDSMDVKDHVITVGMVVRKGVISEKDAEVVKRTREAGGILLGITNVPECLMAFETFNSIFGTTRNPYDSRRSPGGSSGGEGALVSSCGSLIGIGSDIGGSVRIPALHCGLFGLKPTTGFVPTQGQLPEGFNEEGYKKQMFCVGPLTRYIEDIPLCLKVFNPEGFKENKIDEEVDLRNIKIFYMDGLPADCGAEPLVDIQKEKLRDIVEYFEKEYNLNTQGISFMEMNDATEMLMASVSDGSPLAHFICKDKKELDGSKLITEILLSLLGVSDHMFNVLVMTYNGSTHPMSEEEKQAVFKKRDKLRQKIISLLERENAVLLLPTWAHTPKYHGYAVWAFEDVGYTGIWNALSLPVLQCPTGLDEHELPTGVQVVGAPNSDRILLEIGRRIQAHHGGWEAPWARGL
uniref:Amidase domain-containing protein n=1 Tax=Steinernema glaseri TaxID=37863 RepID=A0A1I8ANL3_9BILA